MEVPRLAKVTCKPDKYVLISARVPRSSKAWVAPLSVASTVTVPGDVLPRAMPRVA